MIPLFRVVSIVEGISYLLLMATVISYRMFDGPDATAALGPVHGFLWLAYIVMVIPVAPMVKWGAKEVVVALVASVIPFATFFVERRMLPAAGATANA